MNEQELQKQVKDLNIAVAALHLALASTLALIVHERPDAKQKLDMIENDLLARTIPALAREEIPKTTGPELRHEIARLFRRARKGLGLPD